MPATTRRGLRSRRARVATHLFNAMRPIHHREPGPIPALLESPDVVVELVHDGIHLHPAVYRHVVRSVGSDRIALVTDAMTAAGMSDGTYRLGSLTVEVAAGEARVVGTGTLAGSTATMDQLFRNAVRSGPADPDQALLAAVRQTSTTPARVLGLDDRSLSAGQADVVVLDASLTPTAVMIGGTWAQLSRLFTWCGRVDQRRSIVEKTVGTVRLPSLS